MAKARDANGRFRSTTPAEKVILQKQQSVWGQAFSQGMQQGLGATPAPNQRKVEPKQ